ncbi:MAG: SOS response-associated peptidase family protein [Eggerthellaceae bacterium]|nr:SOS response-associated peptidase family protein [Eggerthellaceae bacterium]
MCGRYSIDVAGAAAGAGTDKVRLILESLERRYPGQAKTGEIAPGDTAPALIGRDGRVVAVPAAFGWPGFDDGRPLINARAETAAVKPTFAESLTGRRIILPATGFFEWGTPQDGPKVKYLFSVDESPVMYLCGLYRAVEGQLRFVILTRAANDSVAEVHSRMPVIVGEDAVRAYLTDEAAAREILANASPALTRVKA